MADQTEIMAHYDEWAKLHPLRMWMTEGQYPDYSCGYYGLAEGEVANITLAEAQIAKIDWVLSYLSTGSSSYTLNGGRYLDIGSGWGPIISKIKQRGGTEIGITLSPGQLEYCRDRGLNVHLMNYKDITLETFGEFDGIFAVGSPEHFTTPKQYLNGEQEKVLREFYQICHNILKPGGRLFVQTMVWGGKGVPNYETDADPNADPDSIPAMFYRLKALWPGSWPPSGLPQLLNSAEGLFDPITYNSGRWDYVETLEQWGAASKNLFQPRILPSTIRVGLPIIFDYLTQKEVRVQWQSIRAGDMKRCFKEDILDHWRIIFQKV